MTKTLTEQWREGTLPDGKYYIKLEPNFTERYDIGYIEGGGFCLYNIEDIEEVLAPVPSYDHFSQLVKKVERLQEQLSEANEVIKKFEKTEIGHKQKDGTYVLTVCGVIIDPEKRPTSALVQKETYFYDPRPLTKYLEKWGVK